MAIKVTNKTSGLSISVSKVKKLLRAQLGSDYRFSSEFTLAFAAYINYITSQLCYVTTSDMMKNTDKNDNPRQTTLTREGLNKAIQSYSLFSDIRRKASPSGNLPVNNVITFPNAKKLKKMSATQRQKFFRSFNYRMPDFDDNYFETMDELEKEAESSADDTNEGEVLEEEGSEESSEEEEEESGEGEESESGEAESESGEAESASGSGEGEESESGEEEEEEEKEMEVETASPPLRKRTRGAAASERAAGEPSLKKARK